MIVGETTVGKNPKLSRRLARALLVTLLAVLILATAAAAITAYLEASEIQDETLLSVAHLVTTNQIGAPDDPRIYKDSDLDDGVRIWEIGRDSHSKFKIKSSISPGFHTINAKNNHWRIYVTQNEYSKKRFVVAQKLGVSAEMAFNSAKNTAIPLLLLFLIVPPLVIYIIQRSFRPLTKLTQKIATEDSLALDLSNKHEIPVEVLPFVTSIESLLEKNDAYNKQQRRFIADAAHELRTPITALSLEIENVQKAGDEVIRENRQASLTHSVQRLQRLVNQLLDLARVQSRETPVAETVSLNDLVKTQIADFYVMVEDKNIDLSVGKNDRVQVTDMNSQLQHLVRNALSNAIKYTPSGGQISINIGQEGNHATFVVTDSGPGVEPQHLNKLHEPFYRPGGQPSGSGAGLGLAICYEIATQLNGQLKLSNAVPSGFRFSYSQELTDGAKS